MKANQIFRKNEQGFANMVPMVLVVVIAFALLFIGGYVFGTIHVELKDASANADADSTMDNISENWDSGLDIVQVVIIITILSSAIGAIFLFTRFGR